MADTESGDELWVIPGEEPSVTVEGRRLAETLAAETETRPEVVAIGFDGVETDADPAAGAPDAALTLSRSEGAFRRGAAGVAARAAGVRALADERGSPRATLLPGTADSDDLAATIARRFRSGCVTDCLPRIRNGELLAGRAVYGGRAYAEFSFEGGPPALTVHTDVLPGPGDGGTESVSRTTQTVDVPADADSRGIRHVETLAVPESDLARARRIVAGGYGLGDPDGFDLVETLADALGAAVGASRPPADEGWVPYDRQIGVTGKEIDAQLYVPIAISGDPYHMRSVNAEHLIPINADRDARIFNVADFGVVGDAYEYVPAIAAAIREAGDGGAAGAEDAPSEAAGDGGVSR
jgi:electron transfer flavoprotein alpha subunit